MESPSELGMCRSCSTTAGLMIPLTEKMQPGRGDTRSLLEVINIVTNDSIRREDHLPQKLCYQCYTYVRIADFFVTRFRETQDKLKNFKLTNQISAGSEKKDEACRAKNLDFRRKPYQCSICLQRYPNRTDLQLHLSDIHNFGYGDVNKFECTNCNTHFFSYNTYESHLEACNVFAVSTISDCGSSSPHHFDTGVFEERYNDNISSSTNEKPPRRTRAKKKIFPCPKCDMKFDSKKGFIKHSKNEHCYLTKTLKRENDNKTNCTVPHVSNTNLENYNINEERITIKTEEICPELQKSNGKNVGLEVLNVEFGGLSSNKERKKIKTEVARRKLKLVDNNVYCEQFTIPPVPSNVKHYCTVCERKFTKKSSFAAHMEKHEKGSTSYICYECKREFQYQAHLENHQLSVHTSTKGLKCDMCPKRYSSQSCLDLHILSHKEKKKHQCKICDKGFNMLSTLKDHIRTHTGEKPFLCSTCGRSFSQKTNLKEHMRRHAGFKPFNCDTCDQRFVSKGELVAHRRKHSGAHPFVCEQCQSGFTTSSSLVKHRRTHSGERPYECGLCPMRFSALGTLKNHRRTHTGEKPYRCKYCDKSFAQRNDQVLHMRCHTGERPYVCSACGRTFRQGSALKTHLKMCAHVDPAGASAGASATGALRAPNTDAAAFADEANALTVIPNGTALESLSVSPI